MQYQPIGFQCCTQVTLPCLSILQTRDRCYVSLRVRSQQVDSTYVTLSDCAAQQSFQGTLSCHYRAVGHGAVINVPWDTELSLPCRGTSWKRLKKHCAAVSCFSVAAPCVHRAEPQPSLEQPSPSAARGGGVYYSFVMATYYYQREEAKHGILSSTIIIIILPPELRRVIGNNPGTTQKKIDSLVLNHQHMQMKTYY